MSEYPMDGLKLNNCYRTYNTGVITNMEGGGIVRDFGVILHAFDDYLLTFFTKEGIHVFRWN